eukprot:RCo024909
MTGLDTLLSLALTTCFSFSFGSPPSLERVSTCPCPHASLSPLLVPLELYIPVANSYARHSLRVRLLLWAHSLSHPIPTSFRWQRPVQFLLSFLFLLEFGGVNPHSQHFLCF